VRSPDQRKPSRKQASEYETQSESKEKSGFRFMGRCSKSMSRQIPAIATEFSEEDMVFIGKSDRLLA
jgi:hypothetical protein